MPDASPGKISLGRSCDRIPHNAIQWRNPEALYSCKDWSAAEISDWFDEVGQKAAVLAAAEVCDRPSRRGWTGGGDLARGGGDMSRIAEAVREARSRALLNACKLKEEFGSRRAQGASIGELADVDTARGMVPDQDSALLKAVVKEAEKAARGSRDAEIEVLVVLGQIRRGLDRELFDRVREMVCYEGVCGEDTALSSLFSAAVVPDAGHFEEEEPPTRVVVSVTDPSTHRRQVASDKPSSQSSHVADDPKKDSAEEVGGENSGPGAAEGPEAEHALGIGVGGATTTPDRSSLMEGRGEPPVSHGPRGSGVGIETPSSRGHSPFGTGRFLGSPGHSARRQQPHGMSRGSPSVFVSPSKAGGKASARSVKAETSCLRVVKAPESDGMVRYKYTTTIGRRLTGVSFEPHPSARTSAGEVCGWNILVTFATEGEGAGGVRARANWKHIRAPEQSADTVRDAYAPRRKPAGLRQGA